MDNALVCELLTKRWPIRANAYDQWRFCLSWVTSKNIALPSVLTFPSDVQNIDDAHLACFNSSSKLHCIVKIEIDYQNYEGPTAAGLKAVERCSRLNSFILIGSHAPYIFEDLGRMQWQCLKTLECIDLRYCRVCPDCISVMSMQCPALKELSICLMYMRFIDEAADIADAEETMKRLSTIQGLEILFIDFAQIISATGLSYLKSSTNLSSIDINYTRHGDAFLKAVADMPSIRKISLYGIDSISATGFEPFRGGKLTELDIIECNITDENVSSLAGMTNLRCLSLAGRNITDAGLVHLSQLPLIKLGLYTDLITDAGLDRLHSFPQLKEVEMDCLDLITEQGVGRFFEACNNIQKFYCSGELLSHEYIKSLEVRALSRRL